MSEIITREVLPNERQGTSPNGVLIEAKTEIDFPDSLTRLGRKKLTYLIKGIGQGQSSDRVLELFGGTNLSTAVISNLIHPKELVSVDLHNSYSSQSPWRYRVKENYQRHVENGKINHSPSFITADATQLPFRDGVFDLTIAPDSPRSSEQRIGEGTNAGSESTLSLMDQEKLFLGASTEVLRTLTHNGRFIGTAPLSWAEELRTLGFSKVQLFSDLDLPNVTKVNIGNSLRFKSNGVADPVVYFRGVK